MADLRASNRDRLTRGLIEEGVVQFGGPFPLKDGTTSRAYVNLRDVISLPTLRRSALIAYKGAVLDAGLLNGEKQGRYMASVPEATFGLAGALADRMDVPLLQRRVAPKGHGIGQNIMGRFGLGTEVILVDDVVKSSLSKIEEAERLHRLSEGMLTVTGVVVLVDRLQGGRTELESQGLEFGAALTLEGIARYALDERLGGMTQTFYDDLLAELNPQELAQARGV